MSQSTNRRRLLKTLGAGTVLGVAGCVSGDDDSDSGGTTDDSGETTVRMGALGAQSGELGEVGQPIIDAMLLATNQVDAADNGVSVDVQVEDTETDPVVGASRAQTLIDDGYPMICGALSSAVSREAAEQTTVPADTVMCSPASTAPTLSFFDDNRLFFRTAPADSLQGRAMATVAAERLGNESAAVLHVADTYGEGLAQSFREAFENNHDGTVNSVVAFESGRPTYVSQLSSALSGTPETLVLIGFPESGSQILSDFNSDNQAGDIDILLSDGLRADGLPDAVDGSLAGVAGTNPGVGGPGLDFFNERYQEEYGREPGIFNEHAYDAAAALVIAHARADDPQGENIRNELWWNTDQNGEAFEPEALGEAAEVAAAGDIVAYDGVSGPVDFDARGDLAAAVYDHFQYTESGNIEDLDQIEV